MLGKTNVPPPTSSSVCVSLQLVKIIKEQNTFLWKDGSFKKNVLIMDSMETKYAVGKLEK